MWSGNNITLSYHKLYQAIDKTADIIVFMAVLWFMLLMCNSTCVSDCLQVQHMIATPELGERGSNVGDSYTEVEFWHRISRSSFRKYLGPTEGESSIIETFQPNRIAKNVFYLMHW